MENKTAWGYLNGVYEELGQLCIPVLDRGFIYGDGCYEVIPVYHKSCFLLENHLKRWQNSLEKIGITSVEDMDSIIAILKNLLGYSKAPFEYIYLQATRGTYKTREHIFPAQQKPSIFAYIMPFNPPTFASASQGIAAITREDIRWARCDIKSISLLGNVLLRQEAQKLNASETLLFRNGILTEGSISNVFIVQNGIIKTPPLSSFILPGITRNAVLSIANSLKIPYIEETISLQNVTSADEIWVTSSTKEVTPVTRLDGNTIPMEVESSIWKQIFHAYHQATEIGKLPD